MAQHTITLTVGQEAAVLDIAEDFAAQTPPQGDGTVDTALPLLLRYAVDRLRGQVLSRRGDKLRAKWDELTPTQQVQIKTLLEG